MPSNQVEIVVHLSSRNSPVWISAPYPSSPAIAIDAALLSQSYCSVSNFASNRIIPYRSSLGCFVAELLRLTAPKENTSNVQAAG